MPEERRLVIVESPAKAKTIAGYLGAGYVVESSIGHIRDLPERASDVPKERPRAARARLGVDVDDDFEPYYLVDPDKKKVVAALQEAAEGRRRAPARDGRGPRGRGDRLAPAPGAEAEGADAADGLPRDHEGRDPGVRSTNPRDVDDSARRRAGDAADPRPAVRLRGLAGALEEGDAAASRPGACSRSRRGSSSSASASGWSSSPRRTGTSRATLRPWRVRARLVQLDGKRVAQGRDFGHDGQLKAPTRVALDEPTRAGSLAALDGAAFAVRSVERQAVPPPPGAAVHDLDAPAGGEPEAALHGADDDAGRPAPVRARLHHLHAHRLDDAVRDGADRGAAQAASCTAPTTSRTAPRRYERKVKNAQEAHEAIRPSGDRFRMPDQVQRRARPRRAVALYELIWRRTVASQMADARGQTASVRLGATSADRRRRRVRRRRHGDHVPRLPRRVRGGPRRGAGAGRRGAPTCRPEAPATRSRRSARAAGARDLPPARYTEATLVGARGAGIGRPSTYASILGTILDRGYVVKKGTALVPTFLAFAVDEAPRAALREARRLRVHGEAWRTTSTRSPRARSSASTG